MRLYEGLFLFDANLASRDWPGLESHAGDLLKKHGAELVYSERWPDRKLAYEIDTCRKGTYYLTYFNAPADAITGLKRDVQLSERILRVHVMQNEHMSELLELAKKRAEEGPPTSESSESAAAGESSVPAEGAPKAAPEAASTAVADEPTDDSAES